MTSTPVPLETPEAHEYARYLAEIETRKRRAADLQTELESLKLAVGRFEAEYHARVGALFVELDQLKLAIEEYEQRIGRLQAEPDADPADVEDEIAKKFAGQREHVREEDKETRRYQQLHERERERPQLDAGTEDQLKRLFRELAKRFHPDLARTDEERRRRATIMQRVNAAYADRNIGLLQAIASEEEISDPAFEARSIGERLVWAIREVARLDGLIATLQNDVEAVKASGSHALWRRHEDSEGVIERLETDLQKEIDTTRYRLAILIGTYRHLLERPA